MLVAGQTEGQTNLPSFIATCSQLRGNISAPKITELSFIPVLPYKSTSMDSIYTTMKNFQDVLKQRNEEYGALWCDEGVYCIAKEVQLLRPEEFANIWLGMGPFHWTKILVAGMGKFLEHSGITKALYKSGAFLKGAAETSVMKGGDYIYGKDGMSVIAETMTRLQFETFKESEDYNVCNMSINHEDIQRCMAALSDQSYGNTTMEDYEQFIQLWETSKLSLINLKERFYEFCINNNCGNENFVYWNLFIHQIFPILRDHELSVRKGDWDLYVDSIQRSLPLFFVTGRSNYSRWGPFFYQDCLDLQRKFPMLYKHFKKGMFVCNMTQRSTSGIGFDQALEKTYNYDSKASGGIIGFTREKKAVALWNIMKHEKDQYVSFMKNITHSNEDSDELNLHHDFNKSSAIKNSKQVHLLAEYLKTIVNPFKSGNKLINVVNQQELPYVETRHLLDCLDFGEKLFEEFIYERLELKTVSIFSKISTKNVAKVKDVTSQLPKPVPKEPSKDVENNKATRYLEYAVSRGKTHEYMLQFPITSKPFFLMNREGTELENADHKSELAIALLKKIDTGDIIVPSDMEPPGCPAVPTNAVVIDFMGVIRSLTSVETMGLKTFGDLFEKLLSMAHSYGRMSSQIHIIMESYRTISIKSAMRRKRTKNPGQLCNVVSADQLLPEMSEFWSQLENKMSLQNFFVDYCTSRYKSTKPLYIAGGITQQPYSCTKIESGHSSLASEFWATHEEADDRIMYSINKIFSALATTGSVTVVTVDTDIIVGLLFHLNNAWKGNAINLLKKGHIKSSKTQKELYPLHKIKENMESDVINVLLAGHSLTGCDTVAKVGGKTKMLHVLQNHGELIQHFGREGLDEDVISAAEQFLVKVVALKRYQNCLSFDELRVKLHCQSMVKKFVDLPCTSLSLRENIKRAYLQCRLWMEAPVGNIGETMDPNEFGYQIDVSDNTIHPILFEGPSRPIDVPDPCKCTNCSRKTCPCRLSNSSCSKYCGCHDNDCKNPFQKND